MWPREVEGVYDEGMRVAAAGLVLAGPPMTIVRRQVGMAVLDDPRIAGRPGHSAATAPAAAVTASARAAAGRPAVAPRQPANG